MAPGHPPESPGAWSDLLAMARFTLITLKAPIGFALFVVFLVLYAWNAAPDVTWGDSGEFASVAQTLGIAHPTGYPLYVLTGKLLTLLSPFTPARTLNLFSALCSALAVAVLYRTILSFLACQRFFPLEPGPPWLLPAAAAVGASLLGVSPVFISQAVITEVYALTNLFQVLLWYLLLEWWRGKDTLRAFFLTLGLALAHHLSILAFAPFFLLILLLGFRLQGRGQKELPGSILYALPGLSLYLYIPLRAASGPALNWGNPSSLGGLLWTLRGGDFRGMLQFDPLFTHGLSVLGLLARWHAARLQAQFGWLWPLLPALLAVLVYVLIRNRENRKSLAPAMVMAAAVLFTVFYFSFYMVGDQEVFFVMTYPVSALLIAAGLVVVATGGQAALKILLEKGKDGSSTRYAHAVPLIILAIAAILLIQLGVSSFNRESARHDRGARLFGETVIEVLPPGSLLLVGLNEGQGDNSIYPLWYQKWALGRGEDVAVIGANFFNSPWYQFQLPEDVWFPSQSTLKGMGLVVETEGMGTVFTGRESWIQAILLFLQKNESKRTLYTLSWIEELEPYYRGEVVVTAPVEPGVVSEDYRRFLPSDGRVFKLTARR